MARIKKGDKVQVLAGKDRGRTGTIERVLVKQGKVVVAGVNIYRRHVRKQGSPPAGGDGGIIDIVKPLSISNVALVCPGCRKPARVGFSSGNGKIRVCKKCGQEIK